MNGKYAIGDTVFNNWILTELLGEGSFGCVYKAERRDFGITYHSAVKIITIPHDANAIKDARIEGMDDQSISRYFSCFVEELVQEISLMSHLKGTSNVVNYEDHSVLPHENGLGWDLLIRMELLTPLPSYLSTHQLTQESVIKLGIDLCCALELCQRFNIIHRDIKPENIFISQFGDYKLGDFGIARTIERTTYNLSKKGTYSYMAPEVYHEEAYGPSADIYSLGMVLYRLLNDNRAPFLPCYPAPITPGDREYALSKRISGSPLPLPRHADRYLANVIMKACAYNAEDRYSNPTEMKHELKSIQHAPKKISNTYLENNSSPISVEEKTLSIFSLEGRNTPREEPEKTEYVFNNSVSPQRSKLESANTETASQSNHLKPQAQKPCTLRKDSQSNFNSSIRFRRKSLLIVTILSLFLLFSIGIVYLGNKDVDFSLLSKGNNIYTDSETADTSSSAPLQLNTTELNLEPTIQEQLEIIGTEGEIVWKSSDKSVAIVDDSGIVTAVGEGTATIIVQTADGREASCDVTVKKLVIDVESISLDLSTVQITTGTSQKLNATVFPEDATTPTVIWESSDPSVASVDKGLVKGNNPGTTVITATCGSHKAICNVTVSISKVAVDTVSLNANRLVISKGTESILKACITPSNATNTTVSWKSSNESVAIVDKGVVTAVGGGTATITATVDGKSSTCTVDVSVPAESIRLSAYSGKAFLPDSEGANASLPANIKVEVFPKDTTDILYWSSSNPSIYTFSGDSKSIPNTNWTNNRCQEFGFVNIRTPGKVTLTFSCGTQTATYELTIIQPTT